MNIRQRLLALPLLAVSTAAWAGPSTVPEPETLALLAIGAVAIVIARWRRK